MPVFLIPMVVGGYYYLKNRKEKEGGSDDQQQTDTRSLPGQQQQITGEEALFEESPSVEVSFVLDQNKKDEESQTVEAPEAAHAVVCASTSTCTTPIAAPSSQSDSLFCTGISDVPAIDEICDSDNNNNNNSLDMDNSLRIEVTPCYSQDLLLEHKNSNETAQTELTCETEGKHDDENMDCLMVSCTNCDQVNLFDFVECAKEVGLVDDKIVGHCSLSAAIAR